MNRHDWHVTECSKFSAPAKTDCDGANIKCKSLKYVPKGGGLAETTVEVLGVAGAAA